jgi:hypothetical protein
MHIYDISLKCTLNREEQGVFREGVSEVCH